MFRRQNLIVTVLVAGLLGAAAADDFKREGKREKKDVLEGKAPPPLEVKDWVNTDGKELKLSDFKGKVVLVDFWGVWCPPCRASVPHMKELLEKHRDAGLVIVGIHTTNGGEKMEAFVKEQGIPWPCAVDVEMKTVKAFGVDSFPDYYLIDRAGNLRIADLANGELDRAVEALLKEPVE